MLREEEIQIGTYTYRMKQLQLRPARALFIKLGNVLGPALGDAIAQGSEGQDVNIGGAQLGKAIGGLFSVLTDADFEYVQQQVLGATSWLNEQGHYVVLAGIADAHFGSDLARLVRLMFEYLKFQYGDFLKDLGLAGFIQMSNQAGQAPSTLIGTSGD